MSISARDKSLAILTFLAISTTAFAQTEAERQHAINQCKLTMIAFPDAAVNAAAGLCDSDPGIAARIIQARVAGQQANGPLQPLRPIQPMQRPSGPVGMLINQEISGFNRICYYNALGSVTAVTIGVTQICPMSVQLP